VRAILPLYRKILSVCQILSIFFSLDLIRQYSCPLFQAGRPASNLASVKEAAAKPLPEAAKTIFDDFSDDDDIGL